MPTPLLTHARRRWRALAALALVAWAPPLLLTLAIVTLGGPGALRDNVFVTLLAAHAAIVAGHALAVPAMLRVLHLDMGARDAVRASRQSWLGNSLLGSPVIVVPFVAASLWPEIWGTVSETLAIEILAAMPFVLVCQMAWMQQVADGGDAPTVAYDTFWLLRRSSGALAKLLVPAYVLLFAVFAAVTIPYLTGPVALVLATIPFTTWSWATWCRVTGASPAWEAPRSIAPVVEPSTLPPTQAEIAASAGDAAWAADAQAGEQPEPAAQQPAPAPVLYGGGGPGRLEMVTAPGSAPAGAWLETASGDSFTVTVQVPASESSRDWAEYLWRPGAQWRELEQLWNDGRNLVAHGRTWGERSYVAIARRDGTPGVTFRAWISIATQSAASAHPEQPGVAA